MTIHIKQVDHDVLAQMQDGYGDIDGPDALCVIATQRSTYEARIAELEAERDALRQALPANIGRLHLGEHLSGNERLCHWGHVVPNGHPLYWPQAISQYDDSDPCCLEHAIAQSENEQGYGASAETDLWKDRATTAEARLAEAVEVIRPFTDEFRDRREAYIRRYPRNPGVGAHNFDSMPDNWEIENSTFSMGIYRRAARFIQETERG